jgi:hypothetical protein
MGFGIKTTLNRVLVKLRVWGRGLRNHKQGFLGSIYKLLINFLHCDSSARRSGIAGQRFSPPQFRPVIDISTGDCQRSQNSEQIHIIALGDAREIAWRPGGAQSRNKTGIIDNGMYTVATVRGASRCSRFHEG